MQGRRAACQRSAGWLGLQCTTPAAALLMLLKSVCLLQVQMQLSVVHGGHRMQLVVSFTLALYLCNAPAIQTRVRCKSSMHGWQKYGSTQASPTRTHTTPSGVPQSRAHSIESTSTQTVHDVYSKSNGRQPTVKRKRAPGVGPS